MVRRNWGEGSYDYRDNTEQWRWRGYYTDVVGNKKRKEITAKTRKVLKQKVDIFLQSIVKGNVLENITVEKWCQIWLAEIVKQSVKVRTYENYQCTIKNHILPAFGKRKLQDLKVMDIQIYLNALLVDHKVSTVITIRNHMIVMLNAGIENGYLKINMAKKTKPPRKDKPEIVILTVEQSQNLLKVAEKANIQGADENDGTVYLRRSYYVAVYLAVTTGMREGEIFGLKWVDVDFGRGYLIVSHNLITTRGNGLVIDTAKTKTSHRKILLTSKTIEILKKWKIWQKQYGEKWGGIYANEHDLVVSNSYGSPVSVTNFSKRYFKKMLVTAGISKDVTFHSIRHAHATYLLKSGVNVKVVSERLGHSSTSVTMDIYAHALPSMQDTAIKAIDEIFWNHYKNQ